MVSKANFSYHVTEHAVMDSAVRRNWQLMVGIRVGESSNSPNTIHTFPLCQVERIEVKIFGDTRYDEHTNQ